MSTIDALWEELKAASDAKVHRRVDDTHPLDLYAEFEAPGRPGLVLFSPVKPPEPRQLKAISAERGKRADGKWWLRFSLHEPSLGAVFSGLCRDVIAFTRTGVAPETAPAAILTRIERWRTLLEGDNGGLPLSSLRGLAGELIVLIEAIESRPALEAVSSWSGPLGSPQDFQFPDGRRIEVKTIRPNADCVKINGLGQLESDGEPLELRVIRLGDGVPGSDGVVTAPSLVDLAKRRLEAEPLALNELNSRLAAGGWYEHPSHYEAAFRIVTTHRYRVSDGFPRILPADVPAGIDDVNYQVSLVAARDFEIPGNMLHD